MRRFVLAIVLIIPIISALADPPQALKASSGGAVEASARPASSGGAVETGAAPAGALQAISGDAVETGAAPAGALRAISGDAVETGAAPPDVLQLSLKKAVEIATAPDGATRVKLAEEELRQARLRADEARAALLPNLDGYLNYESETQNLKAFGFNVQIPPSIPIRIPTFVGPFDVMDARVEATQNIFDLSSILRYRSSRVQASASKQDRESTTRQVTDQVARAYLTGLRADAVLETAHANVDLSEALLQLARSQKEAGTGTGIEVTRAEVQLANDQQGLLVAESDRDRAHLQLLKAMGLKLDAPVELTDKFAYTPTDALDEAQAVAKAWQNRSELKAQMEREHGARLSYDATKYERVPTLAAFGNYGDLGTGIAAALPTRAVGVSLRVPMFDGGRRDARRAESASAMREEQIRTADLRDQIDLDVRVALDSLRSADAQVKTAEQGVKLSEDELAQAERRYKAGVTNSVEVTDAQTRLIRARDNRIAALYNYNLARIDLGTAMGTIENMIP
jgi:outer membrane protein TolC